MRVLHRMTEHPAHGDGSIHLESPRSSSRVLSRDTETRMPPNPPTRIYLKSRATEPWGCTRRWSDSILRRRVMMTKSEWPRTTNRSCYSTRVSLNSLSLHYWRSRLISIYDDCADLIQSPERFQSCSQLFSSWIRTQDESIKVHCTCNYPDMWAAAICQQNSSSRRFRKQSPCVLSQFHRTCWSPIRWRLCPYLWERFSNRLNVFHERSLFDR